MISLKEKVGNVLSPLEKKVRALKRSKHSDLGIDLVIEYDDYFRTWKEVTYEDIDEVFIGNVKKLLNKYEEDDNVTITNRYDEYEGELDSFLSASVEVTADAYDTKDKNISFSITLSFSGDLYKKVYSQVEKFGLSPFSNIIFNVDGFTFDYNETGGTFDDDVDDSVETTNEPIKKVEIDPEPKKGEKVIVHESEEDEKKYGYYKAVVNVRSGKLTGLVSFYHRNGQLRTQYELKSNNYFGGDFIEYHDNGQVAYIRKYPLVTTGKAKDKVSGLGYRYSDDEGHVVSYTRFGYDNTTDEFYFGLKEPNNFIEAESFHYNGKKEMVLTKDLKALYDEDGNVLQILEGRLGSNKEIIGECNISNVSTHTDDITKFSVVDGLPKGKGLIENTSYELKFVKEDNKYVRDEEKGYKSTKKTEYLFDDKYFIKSYNRKEDSGVFSDYKQMEIFGIDDNGVATYCFVGYNYKGELESKKEATFTINDKCLEILESIARNIVKEDLWSQDNFGSLMNYADDYVGHKIEKEYDNYTNKQNLREIVHTSDGAVEKYQYFDGKRQGILYRETKGWDLKRWNTDGILKEERFQDEKGRYIKKTYNDEGLLLEWSARLDTKSDWQREGVVELEKYRRDGSSIIERMTVEGDIAYSVYYDEEGNVSGKKEEKI